MSILFTYVFLSIFPYKCLTVAYTTMTYNEHHRKSTRINRSSDKFLDWAKIKKKKRKEKISKNPKYRTLQAVKLGLL